MHPYTQAISAQVSSEEATNGLEAETASIVEWLAPDDGDDTAPQPLSYTGEPSTRPESRASVSTNIPAVGRIDLTLHELCVYIELHPSLWKAQITATECYNEDAGAVVHRFLVFELHRNMRKDVCLRLDRRRGADVSMLQLLVGSGATQANDVAQLAANKHRILGRGRLENRQEFSSSGAPPTLGELRRLLMVIVEELLAYRIWPENCWFFCSVIQQYLTDCHRGTFISGELFRPTLGREMRDRIMHRLENGVPNVDERREPTTPSNLQTDYVPDLPSTGIPPARPWYLQPSYTEKDLLFAPDGAIRAGTLAAFVERLTFHDGIDAAFNEAFLMTFKTFTTFAGLINELIIRFEKQIPEGLRPEEAADWKHNWQGPVRGRIINTMRRLLLADDRIAREDRAALEKMHAFVIKHELTYPGVQIIAGTIVTVMTTGTAPMRILPKTIHSAPPPILPKQDPSKEVKFLDMDPIEVARQLTLMESELFCKIKASECLVRAQGGPVNDDNIKAAIGMSNKMSDWVNETVLAKEDSRSRGSLIKRFILIADKCRVLHNFSAMTAIVAGLNSPPIRRLSRSWEWVPRRYRPMLEGMECLMQAGKSLPEYRVMLSKVELPCIPFIGVYLMTLMFFKDRMTDNLAKEGGLINFLKRAKTSAIIAEIKRFQSSPHNFIEVKVVREFLEKSLEFDHPQDFYWGLSLTREPIERSDEKMTRLLQDTGFL